ncbi:uncharacterized protein LOC143083105 [Mytilus galloprovincialis]|uniref:uncharacterized protein LOC143083105 n=1 Tax=Mytilus galloprovincialis TaxID=29158 RepID=UPI003F7BE094
MVEQQTTLTESDGTVHSANLAIEGPANNNWADGCSSTVNGQSTAWWILNLPEVAFFTIVRMYLRDDVTGTMKDYRLYVSNTTIGGPGETLCYANKGQTSNPETTKDISCNLLGRKVMFFNRFKVVELCYVEIHG